MTKAAVPDREAVVLAHDVLQSVLEIEELKERMTPEVLIALRSARDVLCWTLGHHKGQAFGDNIAALQQWLADSGYVLVRASERPN